MFVVFLLGLILGMLGGGLLAKGEVRLGQRKLRKTASRRLGIFMIAFFPVILIERFILKSYDPDEEMVDPLIVHGCVAGFWFLASLIVFLVFARKSRRSGHAGINETAHSGEIFLLDIEAPELEPAPRTRGRQAWDPPPMPEPPPVPQSPQAPEPPPVPASVAKTRNIRRPSARPPSPSPSTPPSNPFDFN